MTTDTNTAETNVKLGEYTMTTDTNTTETKTKTNPETLINLKESDMTTDTTTTEPETNVEMEIDTIEMVMERAAAWKFDEEEFFNTPTMPVTSGKKEKELMKEKLKVSNNVKSVTDDDGVVGFSVSDSGEKLKTSYTFPETYSPAELMTTGKDVAKEVRDLWTSGVENKFLLAKTIYDYSVLLKKVSIADIGAIKMVKDKAPLSKDTLPKISPKVRDDKIKELKKFFIAKLPFGEKVYEKFVRIGGSSWLMGFDKELLPNDYNTLDYLTSRAVNEKEVVLKFIKAKLTSSVSREDIKNFVEEAKRNEELKTPPETAEGEEPTNPDEPTDEDSEEVVENAFIKRDGFDAAVFTIKINKKDMLKTRSSNSIRVYKLLAELRTSLRESNYPDFDIELKDSVFGEIVKSARKKEVDESPIFEEDLELAA